MSAILAYVNSLNPFLQGVLGSAVFALLVLLARLLLRGARVGGKSYYRELSRQSVAKHIIYRDFVRSGKPHEFTWGYLFVLSQALNSTIQALCFLVFIGGVWAVLSGSWLLLLGFYLAFNFLLDAGSWLKDWSSEKEITVYDKEVKQELLAKFAPKKKESNEGEMGGG